MVKMWRCLPYTFWTKQNLPMHLTWFIVPLAANGGEQDDSARPTIPVASIVASRLVARFRPIVQNQSASLLSKCTFVSVR
jgi:hypothetical protein